MAKLRNRSGEPLTLPWLGASGTTVDADAVVEVPDDMYSERAWDESVWHLIDGRRKTKTEE